VLSLWIPLFDVDEQTGCLHLVPASHRRGLVPIAMGGGAIRRRLVTVH
jgi:ectoine hydroxylase-related dioxygenase (phytanoyl-CoA dioxygenase family)